MSLLGLQESMSSIVVTRKTIQIPVYFPAWRNLFNNNICI